MLLFPKTFRKKKPAKRLKRSYKPIAKRTVFKAHGDNPLKTYRRRFTDYQVMIRAEVARLARLRNRTSAEMAFCSILDDMRVLYESEKIFLNGDRFILVDMYVKSSKLALEVDGSAHDDQKGYDGGRDKWLLRTYGVRTVRFANAEVFRSCHKMKARLTLELGI
jgi:very-short-patch-repair endonuclease